MGTDSRQSIDQQPEGTSIRYSIGVFQPVVLAYESQVRPQATGPQTCPFCGGGTQDYIEYQGERVNRCRFCELVWKWKLHREVKPC
jgi:hypothetical protein